MSDSESIDEKDSRTVCKYGSKCYQTNPAHLEKYKHPSKRARSDEDDDDSNSKKVRTSRQGNQKKLDGTDSKKKSLDASNRNPRAQPSKNKTEELTNNTTNIDPNNNSFIKEKFLVEMPPDFYQFWEFCKTLNPKQPTQALKPVGLSLVGPFDVIAGKIEEFREKSPEECVLHWRYFRDPPELQTVLKGSDKTGYHIGYFRDVPEELPVLLVSNKAKENGILLSMGDNIFSAVNFYLDDLKKTGDPFQKMNIAKIQNALKKRADEVKLEMSAKTERMVSREKKIVTRTFNKVGLVVPYDKKSELGYRSLAMTNKELLNTFNKLEKAGPDQKDKHLSELQSVFTYASIAADECDFGTGIELGWNIIAHGVDGLDQTALLFLSSNYRLLKRDVFARIAEVHMKNRKRSCDLSVLK